MKVDHEEQGGGGGGVASTKNTDIVDVRMNYSRLY